MFELKQHIICLLSKLYLLVIICLCVGNSSAQTNLVVNGSFEAFSFCPSGNSQINFSTSWASASIGTPDYYNTCSINMNPNSFTIGSQVPRTGAAVAGIAVFQRSQVLVREYIEAQLAQPLVINNTYYVEFYVSLADQCYYSLSRLGCVLSNSVINNNVSSYINLVPQIEGQGGVYLSDKIGWEKISGYYKSTGGEQFIIIGNFYDDINLDTLNLGNGSLDGAYYLIDDVTIFDSSMVGIKENITSENISVYPNPAADQLIVKHTSTVQNNTELIIYNYLGESVLKQKINSLSDETLINTSELRQGVYLYKIYCDEILVKTERVIIIK